MESLIFHKERKGSQDRIITELTQAAPDIVPVKKRTKRMKPNEAVVYPHETLLLSYAPTYYIEKKSFPKFWWYRYAIKKQ